MKRALYTIFLSSLLFLSENIIAQVRNVGIGTIQPDNSAVLDISSSDKGLLIPRMTVEKRNLIPEPANGLLIYQTDKDASGFYFYNGTAWKPLSSASTTEMNSVGTAGIDWATTGNAAVAGDFIGTTSAIPLVFKTSNTFAGQVSSSTNTNVALGYKSSFNLGSGTMTGYWNSSIGTQSLESNTSGIGNLAFGFRALQQNATGSYNVGIGGQALQDNTATGNTGIGYQAMFKNTSGANNLAIGYSAMKENLTGANNVALGYGTLTRANSSGNVAIGASSLAFNISGTDNLAIGYYSGFNATGSRNIFIGKAAGANETGNDKLYVSSSSTTTPLIYGDFAAKFISIGDIPATKRDAVATAGEYGLLVKGGIMSEKVKVALSSSADWADYVFAPNYKLMPLNEVESFIKLNKHLPNVPSADQMAESGLDVTETSAKLMEKIEELTLYVIELKKEIETLKAKK